VTHFSSKEEDSQDEHPNVEKEAGPNSSAVDRKRKETDRRPTKSGKPP
jgi:hypothetical protein